MQNHISLKKDSLGMKNQKIEYIILLIVPGYYREKIKISAGNYLYK